jgi:5-methylcytosine-specific restriction endonuclease McrA
MTQRLRRRVRVRARGRCEQCRRPSAVLRVDHRLPLALGGADELANLWALCPGCDRVKTRADRAAIARRGWDATP